MILNFIRGSKIIYFGNSIDKFRVSRFGRRKINHGDTLLPPAAAKVAGPPKAGEPSKGGRAGREHGVARRIDLGKCRKDAGKCKNHRDTENMEKHGEKKERKKRRKMQERGRKDAGKMRERCRKMHKPQIYPPASCGG